MGDGIPRGVVDLTGLRARHEVGGQVAVERDRPAVAAALRLERAERRDAEIARETPLHRMHDLQHVPRAHAPALRIDHDRARALPREDGRAPAEGIGAVVVHAPELAVREVRAARVEERVRVRREHEVRRLRERAAVVGRHVMRARA